MYHKLQFVFSELRSNQKSAATLVTFTQSTGRSRFTAQNRVKMVHDFSLCFLSYNQTRISRRPWFGFPTEKQTEVCGTLLTTEAVSDEVIQY